MPGSESNPTNRLQDALNVFTDWLRARDGSANFEALCAGHAKLADELRRLHSAFQLAQTAARSLSFHETLREQFSGHKQGVHNVGSDEARAAGDQRPHQ